MTTLSLFKKLGLALVCAALVLTGNSASAAAIRANAGTTFTLLPTADPGVLAHTVDGVVQLSFGGNSATDGTFTFHADVIATLPTSAGQPIALAGTFLLTSADGASTLNAVVEGAVASDAVNPALADFQYKVTFTGGSGEFAGARGRARISGAGLFTSATAGTATWTMKGELRTKQGGKQ